VSYNQDGSAQGVFGQRFASNGARLGSEFQVNSYTESAQGSPDLSIAAARPRPSSRVESDDQDGVDTGVRPTLREHRESPRHGFKVNVRPGQGGPAVAATNGQFVVAWTSLDGQDGYGYGVFAQPRRHRRLRRPAAYRLSRRGSRC
jgi:hypothetical protein